MRKLFLLGLVAMLLPLTTWADITFTLSKSTWTYDGGTTKPVVENVKSNGVVLTNNDDYKVIVKKDGKIVTVDAVKDAGDYDITIEGANGYAGITGETKHFTIERKTIAASDIVLVSEVKKQYGDPMDGFNLSEIISNITSLQGDDKVADAVACLKLQTVDEVEDVVGKKYAVLVRANKEATGCNYDYDEPLTNLPSFNATIVKRAVTVTLKDRESTYNGREVNLAGLNYTIDDNYANENNVKVSFTVTDNKTLKDAGQYGLTAKVSNDNYLLNNSNFNYTINKATIHIEPIEGATFSKPYDNKPVSVVTNMFSITTVPADIATWNEDSKLLDIVVGQTNTTPAYAQPNVGEYLINPTVNGTAIWQSDNGYENLKDLPNYKIEYNRIKYTIAPKTVKYYFAAESKAFSGTEVVIDDVKYTVELDEKNTFVGEDNFTEESTPKAKFEDNVTVKNADDYKLVIANEEDVVVANYTFEQLTEGGKSVFTITPAEMIITAPDLKVSFGELPSEEELAAMTEWSTSKPCVDVKVTDISSNIVNDDIKDIRALLTVAIDESVSGATGEYPEAVIVTLDKEANVAALKNYTIELVKGTLTISGVNALVLDPTNEEEGETVAAKIADNAGAIVEAVTVKNLVNFLGTTGWESDQTIQAEQWYTLVLPFKVTVRELSEQFGYAIVNVPNTNNTDENAIYFQLTMQEIPANTLMAFKVDETTNLENREIIFKNKTIEASTGEWATDLAGNKFIGVYSKKTITDANDWILWPGNGGFYSASAWGGIEIYPLNGYIHFEKLSAKASIFMEEANGEITAINTITSESNDNNAEGWYSVDGVKLNAQPTQKGIYIHNGKKVVIQ